MPHHPVVREHSSSTKVRPVFDASAKGVNELSLNDCVESGPSLILSLLEILLRFRRWNVAIKADIEKHSCRYLLEKKIGMCICSYGMFRIKSEL